MQLWYGFLRQLVGNIIMGIIYLTVRPVSKHLGAFLVGSNRTVLNRQPFHLSNKAKIFVDLFSKVGFLIG